MLTDLDVLLLATLPVAALVVVGAVCWARRLCARVTRRRILAHVAARRAAERAEDLRLRAALGQARRLARAEAAAIARARED